MAYNKELVNKTNNNSNFNFVIKFIKYNNKQF